MRTTALGAGRSLWPSHPAWQARRSRRHGLETATTQRVTHSPESAVEPPERSRAHDSHREHAERQDGDVPRVAELELADAADEYVADDKVEEPPEHVHRRRRKALTRRVGERAL